MDSLLPPLCPQHWLEQSTLVARGQRPPTLSQLPAQADMVCVRSHTPRNSISVSDGRHMEDDTAS